VLSVGVSVVTAFSIPSTSNRLFLALPLALWLFILWIVLRTNYEISPPDLLVRSGPLKWTVPLGGIIEVSPTRNPLSSPALSLDRLAIRYEKQPGRVTTIMISPVDKAAFIRSLCEATAGLRVEGDRAFRTQPLAKDV
jgi:hypothetical protein